MRSIRCRIVLPKPPRPAMAGVPNSRAHRSGPRWLFHFAERDAKGHRRRPTMANETTVNTKPLKATDAAEDKGKYFAITIEHIDVTKNDSIVPLVQAMAHMAYSSRDL